MNRVTVSHILTACSQQGSGAALQDTKECTGCECAGDNVYSCTSCGNAATTTRNPDWPSDFPDSDSSFCRSVEFWYSVLRNYVMVILFLTACNQQGSGAALQNTEKCTQCVCTEGNSYICSAYVFGYLITSSQLCGTRVYL